MFATAFNEETNVLHPPKGWTADQCDALSVHCGLNASGQPVVISCWKPTAEELAEINKTGRVWLILFGYTMQPACLSGHHPFQREDSDGRQPEES